MTPFELNHIVAAIETYSISRYVELDKAAPFANVSVSQGTIMINGIDTGETNKSVSTARKVAVRASSASSALTTQHVEMTIDDQSSVFTITTDTAGIRVFDASDPSLPTDFEAVAAYQSVPFTPVLNPRLFKLNDSAQGHTSYSDLNAAPTGFESESEEFIFIADTYGQSILRVRQSDGKLAQRIALSSSPVAIARALGRVEGEESYYFYAALADNTVIRLDPNSNYAVDDVTNIGTSIECMVEGLDNTLWVICKNGTVLRIAVDAFTLAQSVTSISLGGASRPVFALATDRGMCVSMYGEDKVAFLDFDTLARTDMAVGVRPYGMEYDGQNLYVACVGEISFIPNGANGATRISTPASIRPTKLYKQDNDLYILDVTAKSIYKYSRLDFVNGMTQSFVLETAIDFASSYSGTYVFSNVANAPSQYYEWDASPSNFDLEPQYGVDINTTVRSAPYTITGINSPVPVSIWPSTARLYVNGNAAANGHEVGVGDTVQAELDMPNNTAQLRSAYVTLGTSTKKFVVRTVGEDNAPAAFVLGHILDGMPNTAYDSSTITIQGLVEGTEVDAYVDAGTLIVNGAEVLESVLLTNGDVVFVRLDSGEFDSWTSLKLSVASLITTFSILVRPEFVEECQLLSQILNFENVANAALESEQQSDTITVTGLLEPMELKLYSSFVARFVHNGLLAGDSITINEGDTLGLRITLTSSFYTAHSATVNSCGGRVEWTVLSEEDVTPHYVGFRSFVDGWLYTHYPSDVVAISGMSENAVATAVIVPECAVLVNGVLFNDKEFYLPNVPLTFTVKNEDTLQLLAFAGRPYGTTEKYMLRIGRMETSYSVSSRDPGNPEENPFNDIYGIAQVRGFDSRSRKSAEALKLIPVVTARHEAYGKKLLSYKGQQKFTESPRNAPYKGQQKFTESPRNAPEIAASSHILSETQKPIVVPARVRIVRRAEAEVLSQRIKETNQILPVLFKQVRIYSPRPATAAVTRTSLVVNRNAPTKTNKIVKAVSVPKAILQERKSSNNKTVLPLLPEAIKYYPRWANVFSSVAFAVNPRFINAPAFYVNPKGDKFADLGPIFTRTLKSQPSRLHLRTGTAMTRNYRVHASAGLQKVRAASTSYLESVVELFSTHHNESVAAQYARVVPEFRFIVLRAWVQDANTWHRFEREADYQMGSSRQKLNAIPGFIRQLLQRRECEINGFNFTLSPSTVTLKPVPIKYEHKPLLIFDPVPGILTHKVLNTYDPKVSKIHRFARRLFDPSVSEMYRHARNTVEEPSADRVVKKRRYVNTLSADIQDTSNRFTTGKKIAETHGVFLHEFEAPEVYRVPMIEHADPDHQILTPAMFAYFASSELAIAGAIAAGIEPGRTQSFELYPRCWVWSEILDQPDLCEEPEPEVVSGWIKGG